MDAVSASILTAVIVAATAATGWLATHYLASRRERENQWLTASLNSQRERENQRLTASLDYIERQLEELYGPLAMLRIEGEQAYRDLLQSLGRDSAFEWRQLSNEDLRTWIVWAENDLIPRNEKMRNLILGKTHLIDGDKVPESFVRFLEHHNSWKINHERWKQEGVEYSWRSKVIWPKDFGSEVSSSFDRLKAKHRSFLDRLE